jgi:adenosylcobinamide-GDP ribazoletransferase
MRFWLAWQFLTIIPVPRRYQSSGIDNLGASTAFFPMIGLILGLLLLGLDWSLGLVFPSIIVNTLLIIALLVVTGALHFDGFVDTCDGLVVKGCTAEKLRLMEDTQVGAFGVAGGCCLLLAKFAALYALPHELRATILLLLPVLSRWVMVFVIYAFPAAKRKGLGWSAKQGTDGKGIAVASIFAIAVAAILLKWWGAVLLGLVCLILGAVSHCLCSRFGGLTGDNYGAISELSEVVVPVLAHVIGTLGAKNWLVSMW